MKEINTQRDSTSISAEQEKSWWRKWLVHDLDSISESDWSKNKPELKDTFRRRLEKIFEPELLQKFLQIFDDDQLLADRELLITKLGDNLYEMQNASYPNYAAVEEKLRGGVISMHHMTSLTKDNSLAFVIDPEGYSVSLHVPPSLSLSNKIGNVREGMRALAIALTSEEGLSNIQLVSARSALVQQHPGLLEKLGFTISTDRPDVAYMDVEEFKKRWLKDK